MELLKQLIDDLENANARLATLEHVFFKLNPLSPTEYRHELELQRRKLQGHFDELRAQLASLPR